MPKESPLPDWTGEDVFLIGGGSSLDKFDFRRLVGLSTIGANQAFFQGPEICNICAFGDFKFWNTFGTDASARAKGFEYGLESFGGWVATDYHVMNPPGWLKRYNRQDYGLSVDPTTLAWNSNTGALMINLAMLLGARRVFLLGYDLGATKTNGTLRSHWHDKQIEVPTEGNYLRFDEGFRAIKSCMDGGTFSDREVINVTDGGSKLNHFPRITMKEALEVMK